MTATTAAREALEIEARPPPPLLALTEGRAVFELAAFFATRPLLGMLPKGDGHPVLVLPGFLASDGSTKPMRRLLKDLGYDAYGWKLGRNVRVDLARVHEMERLLLDIFEKTGRKVSIVGWSLGGVFARELAKLHPHAVREVIPPRRPIHDQRPHPHATRPVSGAGMLRKKVHRGQGSGAAPRRRWPRAGTTRSSRSMGSRPAPAPPET